MPSHTPAVVSTSVKFTMALTFFFLCIPLIFVRYVYYEVTRRYPGWPIRMKLFAATMKSTVRITPEQRLALLAPSGDIIARYCRLYHHTHVALPLPITHDNGKTPEATLHFIDCKPEDTGPVLLFLHGGGYCYTPGVGATGGGHCEVAVRAAVSGRLPKTVMLEYSLAPGTPYPGQLVQAVAALEYLLTMHAPGDIVLAGDSAGGNLALAVITHLTRPSPYAPPVDLKGAKLRGVALISPWVGLTHERGSYERNHRRDFLPVHEAVKYHGFWNPVDTEVWADPLLLPEPELRRAPVEHVLITGGCWEMLCDDIVQLGICLGVPVDAEAVVHGQGWRGSYVIGDAGPVAYLESKGAAGMRVEVVMGEREAHAMPTIESLLDLKEGVTNAAMREWFERLAGVRGDTMGDDVLV